MTDRSIVHPLADQCEQVVTLAAEIEALALHGGAQTAAATARSRVTLADLADALKSRHALTRIKALSLLSYFDISATLHLYAAVLLRDTSPLVRHEAAYFLGACRADDAVDLLATALLHDENELVRHEAAEALGEHGSGRGIYWLEKALRDSSDVVAETAAVALDRLQAHTSR